MPSGKSAPPNNRGFNALKHMRVSIVLCLAGGQVCRGRSQIYADSSNLTFGVLGRFELGE